ncbi:MAG TPA: hypothetical protein VGM82_01785 [Gemmatimonadaceae bacterium]
MRLFSLLVLGAAVACAGSNTPTSAAIGDRSTTIDTVQVNGALRLEVHDAPLTPSTPPYDAAATIVGNVGNVGLAKAQLGSLCRYAVSGNSDVRTGKIGVHIQFVERLTSCTAELRVLSYNATLTAAPGAYDVALIHEFNGVADTIARQAVTVR